MYPGGPASSPHIRVKGPLPSQCLVKGRRLLLRPGPCQVVEIVMCRGPLVRVFVDVDRRPAEVCPSATVVWPSGADDEARWGHALTPARRTLGRLAQSRALLEDECTGEALRRFDTQALAAMPERAPYVLEVVGDFSLADPDTHREFTSRERALPEDLPERRPYRCVSLDERVWAWPFRQRVHLRSYNTTLDALDTPIAVGRH